jgi:hypothetical protein
MLAAVQLQAAALVTWLDIEMTGTLADLAHSRADLA